MLGNKQFEFTNHLGNVLATITDRKIPHNNNGTIDFYTADISSATDLYPFGMEMPGRSFNLTASKYGFNGKLKDNEITGVDGASYDFGARIYDSRIGRWLACDPLSIKYPELSPYQFVANNPLIFIDPDGEKIRGVKYNTETGQFEYSKAAIKRGTDKYINARITTETGKASVMKLIESPKRYKISVTDKTIVGQSGINQYTVAGGLTEPGKFIVLTTNTIGTTDLMNQGSKADKLAVYEIDDKGNIKPIVILRSQLAPTLTAPDPNNKFQVDYQKAYKNSGLEAFDSDPKNATKSDEQSLHRLGAHEETHLLQDKKLDTYNSELPAMQNEVKEAKEYIDVKSKKDEQKKN